MKSVTYVDLENAAPVVEIGGVTFEDGVPIDVEDGLADFLEPNPFFDVAGSSKKKPGRPAKPEAGE